MSHRINRVAVLGSGTMGSQIAAHCANAGLEVLLLDVAPKELTAQEQARGLSLESKAVKNRIVNSGLEAAKKIKPAAFFSPRVAGLITTGTFEDDLERVSGVDWIVEAIVEKVDIKRDLFARVELFRKAGTIVSSNTSGIPIKAMAEGMSFLLPACLPRFWNTCASGTSYVRQKFGWFFRGKMESALFHQYSHFS